MRIVIANLQRYHPVDRPWLRRLAGFFMEKTAAMNAARRWVECSIVIVGDERMARLNQDVLGHEGVTDVITFAYPPVPGEEPSGWRGEIVINIAEASRNGLRHRGGARRELALYLAHGIQHLGGADDGTPAQRRAMNARQNRWLRQCRGRIGL